MRRSDEGFVFDENEWNERVATAGIKRGRGRKRGGERDGFEIDRFNFFFSFFSFFFLRPSIARDGREILTPFSPTTSSPRITPVYYAYRRAYYSRLRFDRDPFFPRRSLYARTYMCIYTRSLTFRNTLLSKKEHCSSIDRIDATAERRISGFPRPRTHRVAELARCAR